MADVKFSGDIKTSGDIQIGSETVTVVSGTDPIEATGFANVTSSGADLSGELNNLRGDTDVEVYVLAQPVGEESAGEAVSDDSSTDADADNSETITAEDTTFTHSVSGLQSDTEYWWLAIAGPYDDGDEYGHYGTNFTTNP